VAVETTVEVAGDHHGGSSPVSESRLIVTADDLGLTRSINEGVFEAHANGIVNSASLMPTAGAFEEAVYVS
jgi:predicted glycoside hydrolase/deacetylase ChbG (UPF0249 family)